MIRPADLHTAIIVPARNEAERIGPCLAALAHSARSVAGVVVVIVANGCEDGTANIARALATHLSFRLEVLDRTVTAEGGVGMARRLGADHALAAWPEVTALLSTDADCLVADDWIARSLDHLRTVSGVCGRVAPIDTELSVLDGIDIPSAEREGHYERLVLDFYRRMRPGPLGLEGDHGAAAGASLGVRSDAYLAVGGFADIAKGEDRDLVRRLKAAGFGVRHTGDVRVSASCRLDGRAAGGMADALRARAERRRYFADEALLPARVLIDAGFRGDLPP